MFSFDFLMLVFLFWVHRKKKNTSGRRWSSVPLMKASMSLQKNLTKKTKRKSKDKMRMKILKVIR